jgi:hypothetical protein
MTRRSGANQQPLADARGSVTSHDREGVVSRYRTKSCGQGLSAATGVKKSPGNNRGL